MEKELFGSGSLLTFPTWVSWQSSWVRTALQIGTWEQPLFAWMAWKESGPWRLTTFPAHLFPLPFLNNLLLFLFINICSPQTQLLGSALLNLLPRHYGTTFLPLSSLSTALTKGLTFCLPLPPSLSSGHLLRSPFVHPWDLSLKLTIAYELPSKYLLKFFLLVKTNNRKEASVFLVTVIVPYLVRRADNAVFLFHPQTCYMGRVETPAGAVIRFSMWRGAHLYFGDFKAW